MTHAQRARAQRGDGNPLAARMALAAPAATDDPSYLFDKAVAFLVSQAANDNRPGANTKPDAMARLVNRLWDHLTADSAAAPDAVIAAVTGLPKWQVIRARAGYRRPNPTARPISLAPVAMMQVAA